MNIGANNLLTFINDETKNVRYRLLTIIELAKFYKNHNMRRLARNVLRMEKIIKNNEYDLQQEILKLYKTM